MATFLLKTEPSTYGYADLVREGRTAWEGVRNPVAQRHLRAVRQGDDLLIYHTGDEKRIAGLARCVRGAYADPVHPGETTADGEMKWALIDLEPVRAAGEGATLRAIKADPRFAEFALVRQPRLSVMPVPATLAKALRSMAGC